MLILGLLDLPSLPGASFSLLATAVHRGNSIPWVPAAIVVTILIFSTILGLWVRGLAQQNLAQVADRLGLTLHETWTFFGLVKSTPLALGRHRGREVGLFSFALGGEQSKSSWVGVFAACAGHDDWVVLISRPTTFWSMSTSDKVRIWVAVAPEMAGGTKVIRGKYVLPNFAASPTGDETFDRLYTIKSNLPGGFPAKLFPSLRDPLVEDKPANGRLAINNGQVLFIYPGSFSQKKSLDRIAGQLDFVCELVEKMETLSAITCERMAAKPGW